MNAARGSARLVQSIRVLTHRTTEVRIGVDESSSRAAEIEAALNHIAVTPFTPPTASQR